MDKIVKEKLRALQCTQETINVTADYFIENTADAKRLIKGWNEEFTNSSVSRKLALLYLANDILQRCKTNAFHPGFQRYLPKATAHLYKHGDEKMRAAVERLVSVWNERKVLKSQGMAAVQSHLEKVKDTPTPPPAATDATKEAENEEESGQGTKRKRGVHPALECLGEVEKAEKQRKEIEEAIANIIQKRDLTALSKDELMKLNMLYEQHYGRTKSEMRVRKAMVDLLRETLSDQENGLQTTKEMLRVCVQRQEAIKKALATNEGVSIQELVERRESVSLSEENLEPPLLPPEDSSSTMNLPEQSHHSYDTPPMAYPVSLIPSYSPPAGHMCFTHQPNRQHVHNAVHFAILPVEDGVEKATKHEMPGIFHQNPHLYVRQGYMPDDQTPPLASYDSTLMHGGLHNTFDRHQVNYGGYPSQYETEKNGERSAYFR